MKILNLQKIKHFLKLPLLKLLIAKIAIGCVLLGIRIVITQELYYIFLLLNLFLGLIPLSIAYYLYKFQQKNPGRYILIGALIFMWLLFFPNAPYVITDFIHLYPKADIPFWFDGILIFFFAMTSLNAGLMSLYFIHEALNKIFTRKISWLFIGLFSALSGYGIYIGRFLRWHSKDLFFHPISVGQDLIYHLRNPVALSMIVIFFFLVLGSYIMVLSLINLKKNSYDS